VAGQNAQLAAHDVEFALIAESGSLEHQAVLLVESVRRFGGRWADAAITVVSPRASRRPTPAASTALKRLGAELLALDLPSACPSYGTSWRVHSLAAVERRPGPAVLVQLDSDTLFLDVLPDGALLAARPVDVQGMTTTGPADPNEAYWHALCALAKVDLGALPFVTTTVERIRIRASYNGGFVATRRDCGLFGTTEEIFRRVVKADLRPHGGRNLSFRTGTGEMGPAATDWWGSAQAALSVAATALGLTPSPLPPDINVPLHLWDVLPERPVSLRHVHYHWLCDDEHWRENPLLDGRIAVPSAVDRWLRARIPLGRRDPRRRRLARTLRR
jgi:hypothetical protein